MERRTFLAAAPFAVAAAASAHALPQTAPPVEDTLKITGVKIGAWDILWPGFGWELEVV